MLTSFEKSQFNIIGERGLPEHYPIPTNSNDLLFYIQRNLNMNTVIYLLNFDSNGLLNIEAPMKVHWLKYSSNGQVEELNDIQNKLAFGYKSKIINNETFEFTMVSYDKLKFFIAKNFMNGYSVITKIQDKDAYLTNIYVYADELGLFPDVKYIELYGHELQTQFPCYQKILI